MLANASKADDIVIQLPGSELTVIKKTAKNAGGRMAEVAARTPPKARGTVPHSYRRYAAQCGGAREMLLRTVFHLSAAIQTFPPNAPKGQVPTLFCIFHRFWQLNLLILVLQLINNSQFSKITYYNSNCTGSGISFGQAGTQTRHKRHLHPVN
jgi:hypothetical protein